MKPVGATGALAQIFRCAHMYPRSEELADPMLLIVKSVQGDPRYVRKLETKDATTSDALKATLGAMSNGPRPKAGSFQEDLVKAISALGLQIKTSNGGDFFATHKSRMLDICRGCSKEAEEGRKLLKCSRCHAAHYCNAACQKKGETSCSCS